MFQIDLKGIEDHERKYEEMRSERDQQRRERMEELEKMLELQQEEIQQKYKSSYDTKGSQYMDPKEI